MQQARRGKGLTMNPRDFYRLTEPTEWAGPPEKYSYSSMKQMAVCLLQWQLGRSSYQDLKRYPEKPSEPADIGVLVHEILSNLFRAMAIAGYPEIGTEAFQSAVAKVNILGMAKLRMDELDQRVTTNPRAVRFRLQSTPRDVYNKVAQAFRQEYAAVSRQASSLTLGVARSGDSETKSRSRHEALEVQGFLSEEEVEHPQLPLRGFIDLLVRRDNQTTVLDFKTGAPQPHYREQLRLYALMWWRGTGDLPTTIELRYGAKVEQWPVTEEELVCVEREIEQKIRRYQSGLSARPAVATPGEHCNRCGVRQLCDAYWASKVNGAGQGTWIDVEVVVESVMNRGGFMGRGPDGDDIAVVCEEDVAAMHGPFVIGERIRIVNAQREADESAVQITRTAEVFRVGLSHSIR